MSKAGTAHANLKFVFSSSHFRFFVSGNATYGGKEDKRGTWVCRCTHHTKQPQHSPTYQVASEHLYERGTQHIQAYIQRHKYTNKLYVHGIIYIYIYMCACVYVGVQTYMKAYIRRKRSCAHLPSLWFACRDRFDA